MNSKNLFDEAERIGRDLFIEFISQFGYNVKERELNNPVDLDFSSSEKNLNCSAEIKVRSAFYDSFIITDKKLKSLLRCKYEEKKNEVLYVNFIGEDRCIYWNIETITKYSRKILFNKRKTTVIYTGWESEESWLIPSDRGYQFIKENGKWIRV